MSEILKRMLSVYMEEDSDGTGSSGGSAAVDGENAAVAAGGVVADDPENKGERKPTDEEAKLIKEVMNKKKALQKLQDELAEKEKVFKQLEELGGLDLLKQVITDKKTAEQKKLEERGEWDRLKSQMNEEHGKILSDLQRQLEEVRSQNSSLMGEISNLTVGSAFAQSSYIKEDLVIPPAKVKALYGSYFEFQDGKPVAYDKPAGAAERTMLVDAKGDALDFESAIKKIIDTDPDRDQLLKSKIKQGSGSHTNNKTEKPGQLEKPAGINRIHAALAKTGLTK